MNQEEIEEGMKNGKEKNEK
jgi:hypothetical protein